MIVLKRGDEEDDLRLMMKSLIAELLQQLLKLKICLRSRALVK